MAARHPLDPLGPEEISKTTRIVRDAFPHSRINFRVITLKEPLKQETSAFLEAEHAGANLNPPTRTAMVHILVSESDSRSKFLDLRVDLDASQIVRQDHMVGRHSFLDASYMKDVEKACLADEKVQKQITELELSKEAIVVVEPWAYATDGVNDMSERITMCYFYLRFSDNADANYYAYPLDVCAEVSEELEVLRVYRLPSGEHDQTNHAAKLYDHEKVHTTSEYHPDFIHARTTTRPYQVFQPDGPSFQVDSNHVTWEKWTFRVGFNYREGMTLHDVRFDNRSIFYRLSLAEMFVPYGDSRHPYQRKAAFDLGNDGAGINANNLRLGCDCLGHIKYFDGWHNNSFGEPVKLPNVICCHEVDDGLLWKHTNFRTNNPVVARSRILILQTVVTVSNYEYVFAFHFKQDASLHYEVRATGILSTAPIDIGDTVPFGIVVAPGVLAPYHQHLFSLRIDPAIGGHHNSLVIEETVPMPYKPSAKSSNNQFGIGFTNTSQITENERYFDLDHTTNRAFKIVNEHQINPITKTPISYQLIPHYSQSLLAHPSSLHARRSEFADHAVWVTRYNDDELYPAGTFTMQSPGSEGIASWIRHRRDAPGQTESSSVRNEDIVIWHTFGSTHIPRIEDWPVMPCEKMGVALKPVNFFSGNPGIDVPVASQEVSQSVLVTEDTQGNRHCDVDLARVTNGTTNGA